MTHLHTSAVVVDQGRVLLIQREDIQSWALPGGQTEPGESVAQAAMREVLEETGLEVELRRLVGIYAHPHWPGDSHSAIFLATPLRGTLRPQESEALAVQYFSPDALPQRLLWWHHQPILDALAGVGGSAVWSQHLIWPFQNDVTPQQFYEWRSRGEIPDQFRQAFWDTLCRPPQSGEQTREVGE